MCVCVYVCVCIPTHIHAYVHLYIKNVCISYMTHAHPLCFGFSLLNCP